jgi:Zn-dependent peptidase ImmA (M78 family)
MISLSRKKEICGLARDAICDHHGLILPIEPKKVAESLNITVLPFTPESSDISGFLMQSGNSFGIGYSATIKSAGFQNFTIAHELGHYFIPDHAEALLGSGNHISRSGYISDNKFEREADIFASEFLMPWKLIDPFVNRGPKGLSVVCQICESCQSSLLASAIRYSEVTKECIVVIVSHQGVVEFMTASEPFRSSNLEWLKRGDNLPNDVPSSRLGRDLNWVQSGEIAEEGSFLDQWFPRAHHLEVEEDVIGLGSYGRVLTILFMDWSPDEEAEEENSDDDSYIDRWKEGRFRH